jgi:hypothetical protein
MISDNVMNESRDKARELIQQGKPVNRTAAAVIISIWLLTAALIVTFIVRD